MTEPRITTATSFPWAGFAAQIPAGSAEDVQRAKEWSARQARKPWPVLSPNGPLARRERHRRVQEWRQSRPVVVTVRQNRHGYFRGWWDVECPGEQRRAFEPHQHLDACDYARRLAEVVRSELGSDTEEPPNA